MNVIVTGASGLLGRAVVNEFKRNSWKVLGLAQTRVRGDLVAIDVTNKDALSNIVREFKPHAIIHCAAERSPDKVQANPDAFVRLNVEVPAELAKLAREIRAVFVFISSDYVFSGEEPPYREDDGPNPVNEYGMHKVRAERAVMRANIGSLILRIPVLYGGEEYSGESAIASLINVIKSNGPAEVCNYCVRYPSHTTDIASVIYQLVQKKLDIKNLGGFLFHWCGAEPLTKYEMATIIAQTFGRSIDHVTPIDAPVPTTTPRPVNCHLSCEKLENLGIQRQTRFVDGIQEYRRFFE